jgi:hypothetical protein
MSGGFLPVSPGRALALLVQAAFRRLRGAALVMVPFDETGYQQPAPEDFAVLDTIMAFALLVGFCGFVWCALKLRRQRVAAKVEAPEGPAPARKPQATLPSLDRQFSQLDVERLIARIDPHLPPVLVNAMASISMYYETAPALGAPWREWLEENFDRLKADGIAALEAIAKSQAFSNPGGGS